MVLNICFFITCFTRFIDDLLKIKLENSGGLNSKIKFFGQFLIGLIASNFNSIFGS